MSGMNHRFQRSLLLAQACLAETAAAPAKGDPLGLNLPSLFNPASEVVPDANALRALASLYLNAELEQTGLVLVAEALAYERAGLALQSEQAVAKLERFAGQQRDWYDRTQRLQLFERLFGLGGTAVSSPTKGANHTFQQQFGHLCHVISQTAEDYHWGQTPGPTREATLRLAARALLFNLASRQFGNTLLAGRKIQAQMQAAIDILDDPNIGGLVRGRGLWDTLRKILGDQTPDLGRLLNRGQSGQRLLTWLALALPALQRDPPGQPLLPAGSPAFVWAATWLEATVISKRQGG
jgi:hypothetical protein